MRTGTTARGIAITGAALLALAACSSGGSDKNSGGSGSSGGSGEKQVNVYGTDGNMGNALGDDFKDPGSLAGINQLVSGQDIHGTGDFGVELLDQSARCFRRRDDAVPGHDFEAGIDFRQGRRIRYQRGPRGRARGEQIDASCIHMRQCSCHAVEQNLDLAAGEIGRRR